MKHVHFLHWMSWPGMTDALLEANDGAAFLTFPNSEYDPVEGSRLMRRWLDELVAADRLGFDGLVYNEHHQMPHAHLPAANVISAALATRTERARLIPLGHVLPVHHPLQLAEEIALVDLLSQGRVVAGLSKGIGHEFLARSIDPGEARGRFDEAVDVMVRAWTEPGPFSHTGEFWHLPVVNMWPRPLQRPHPPIWITGTGSPDTPAWAASRGYPYVKGLDSDERIRQMFDIYRAAAERSDRAPKDTDLVLSKHVYMAESEAEAWQRGRQHYEYVLRMLFAAPDHYWFPPGSVPPENYSAAVAGMRHYREASIEQLVDEGIILIGTPDQITEKLLMSEQVLGCGQLVVTLAFGKMTAQETGEHLEMFAERVLPIIRPKVSASRVS